MFLRGSAPFPARSSQIKNHALYSARKKKNNNNKCPFTLLVPALPEIDKLLFILQSPIPKRPSSEKSSPTSFS